MRSHGNDGQLFKALIPADRTGGGIPIHHRHLNTHEHRVIIAFLYGVDCLLTIICKAIFKPAPSRISMATCRLIQGTYQGRFESKYLQIYLDESVFRFNRKKSKSIGIKFMRIVQRAVKSAKATYEEIKWDLNPISEYFTT
jgi:hypothetical protein